MTKTQYYAVLHAYFLTACEVYRMFVENEGMSRGLAECDFITILYVACDINKTT